MGAQWKHQGKSESANKRGAIISKLTKEIIVASRMGGPDPTHNPRLRAAVEAARKQSVPRDTIERGIKKGAGLLDETVIYETVFYEAFAPHKIPLIIECLTDNKNRSASSMRAHFKKEGHLGSAGSVMWMFNRCGVIEATHKDKTLDIESVAIEAGAENVEPLEEKSDDHTGARFFCDPTDLDIVNKFLTHAGWTISHSELNYIAKDFPELSPEQKKEVAEFLSVIDDDDDVHRLYVAMK